MTITGESRTSAISAGAAVALVGTLGASYVISLFLRSSIAVIAPDLAT